MKCHCGRARDDGNDMMNDIDGDDGDYGYWADDDRNNITCIWRHMVLYLIPYEVSV